MLDIQTTTVTYKELKNITNESLRDWFKKEKWVRISSSGNIAGPCGTSKNKKNPDRCLPKAKAQSLTKGERAATAAKKKKAGVKGKTVVKNTKKAKVTKEMKEQWPQEIDSRYGEYIFKLVKVKSDRAKYDVIDTETGKAEIGGRVFGKPSHLQQAADDLTKPQGGRQSSHFGEQKVTKEDIHNLVVGMIHEVKNEGIIEEKDDRCTIAKSKYDTWPSAYASGAVVRCRRGDIWKDVKEEVIDEINCKHGKYYCNHDKKYKCRRGPKKSR